MKRRNYDTPVMAHYVKMTASLVATAELSVKNYPWWSTLVEKQTRDEKTLSIMSKNYKIKSNGDYYPLKLNNGNKFK